MPTSDGSPELPKAGPVITPGSDPAPKDEAAVKPNASGESAENALGATDGAGGERRSGGVSAPTVDPKRAGRWMVYGIPVDTPTKDDIYFGLKPSPEVVPADQVALKNEVERTLTLLRALFSKRETDREQRAHFDDYFRKLLSLSQLGLTPDIAEAEIAMSALQSLHLEIVQIEGGRVKNAYIRRLGGVALQTSIFVLAIWLVAVLSIRCGCNVIHWASTTINCKPDSATIALIPRIKALTFLWVGCQAGAWISFNIRKVALNVYDLSNLESDQVEPRLRLVFTGILSLLFGLIVMTNMASIEIGGFSTRELESNGLIALLVGAFCGLSEQALASAISLRASETITAITGKKT